MGQGYMGGRVCSS